MDHPRSRGVYQNISTTLRMMLGSSPLARGLLMRIFGARIAGGIIPARAGFTSPMNKSVQTAQDHPRSRGVYVFSAGKTLRSIGSSPLARGLPSGRFPTGFRCGIIPARAGFTDPVGADVHPTRDHPRSRGVYPCIQVRSGFRGGSSPLARGLLRHERLVNLVDGIIPARAGFTRDMVARTGDKEDHPRSRGVYQFFFARARVRGGSSPLARGLRVQERAPENILRIIPARAGFTCESGHVECDVEDHPRSRGVYIALAISTLTEAGSSPLARGLHREIMVRPTEMRIIPARAGFTRRQQPGCAQC